MKTYLSECRPAGDGKNAKGDYFAGRVNVPFNGKRALLMKLDLVATEDVVSLIKQALRNSCELLRQRKELHASL